MKKIIILFCAIIFSCSTPKKSEVNEIGYIIEKDYEPTTMCCKHRMLERKLIVVVVPHPAPVHHHVRLDAKFTLWFANRAGVKSFSVDSITYLQFNPSDKVLSSTDTNGVHFFYIIKD